MNNVPHWQWLLLIYFLLVAIPVFAVHILLKKKLLNKKTFTNLLLYFVLVIGTAVLMHLFSIWFYFTFIFDKK